MALAAALGCGACTQLHGEPQDGTETGNPPVAAPRLDEKLVALIITADQVRVTGQPGAASPTGATVEVVSALTGEIFSGPVGTDGSFDVRVSGSRLDTFQVRIIGESAESSNSVYVVPGAAAVTSGSDGDELSCDQRTELAAKQLEALITGPQQPGDISRTTCRIDSDCTAVLPRSACNASCSHYAVSKVAAAELEAAAAEVEAGLCKDFAADGCMLPVPSCLDPGEIACVGAFQCQFVQRSGPECADRPLCVNGIKQIWPSVCVTSISPDAPGAGVSVVCIENDRGEVALITLGSDQVVTNKGWFNSAYGLFPNALSPAGQAKCDAQKAALGAQDLQALGACIAAGP